MTVVPPFDSVVGDVTAVDAPAGGPGGAGPAMPAIRVGIAFNDVTLEPTPTWTYLTDQPSLVASYAIERGRAYEFDRTDTAKVTVTINDRDGILDPTNASGPYYGLLEPLLQLQVELWNPVTSAYYTRFRGFIEDFDYTIHPSQNVTVLTIGGYGIFAILTAIEMQPGQFGDTPPTQSEGNVFFDNAADVQTRIDQVLGDAGIPADFYVAFTGNVALQETVYSPSENVMQVIQDAADAEFPTVANVYEDRKGRLVFHGRLARFDPEGVIADGPVGTDTWDWTHWKAGDGAAVNASPSDTAQIRALAFNRGIAKVYNSAFCIPTPPAAGWTGAEIEGQVVTSTTSISQYGYRSWSAENLLIDREGPQPRTGNTGLQECKMIAEYIIANYQAPQNRVTQLTFRSMRPDDPRAAANWLLLCKADISDRIDITEHSASGNSFDAEPFFIEGIHEEAEPLDGRIANVTLTLDISPAAFFQQTAGLAAIGRRGGGKAGLAGSGGETH